MDEKMQEAMKGIYDNLSDELKEKAKQCKTMDELMELAEKEGIELPDDVLDAVDGAYCARWSYNIHRTKCPYEIP